MCLIIDSDDINTLSLYKISKNYDSITLKECYLIYRIRSILIRKSRVFAIIKK